MKPLALALIGVFALSTVAAAQQRFLTGADAPAAGAMQYRWAQGSGSLTSRTNKVSIELGEAIHSAFYKPEAFRGGFRAQNRAQRLDAEFARASTRITTEAGTLELRLLDYGLPRAVKIDGMSLERSYRGLREVFVNDTAGLEQEFVVQKKPAKLLIRLAVNAGWTVFGEGENISFTRGKAKLEYTGLKAWDARGTTLVARMYLSDGVVEIAVDDRQAMYPVTVDPLFTQPIIEALLTDAAARNAGYSVSLSSDGNTALVGAPGTTVGSNVFQGAAYVFTRGSGGWSEQATLTPSFGPGAGAEDLFGNSVSLSADGNTALVGAPTVSTTKPGAAYSFTRIGNTWNQSGSIEGTENGDEFGRAVALSADGTTAIVGIPQFNEASVYTGPVPTSIGPIWAREAVLTPNEDQGNVAVGVSVALSGDGSIALIGAPFQHAPQSLDRIGAAYVFSRSTGWAQQQMLAPTSGTTGNAEFGTSVALTPAGTTALVGAIEENNSQGAAYVFTNGGSSWTQQARLSAPSSGAGAGASFDQFGWSAALSPDGGTALVGAYTKNIGGNIFEGAAYSFARSGSSWVLGHFYTPPSSGPYAGEAEDQFGISVALSSYGSTTLIGADYKNIQGNGTQGAAYVFVSPLVVLTNLLSSLNLPQPFKSQLLSLLQRLIVLGGSLNTSVTTANLQFFIGQVQRAQSFGLIAAPQADQLISVANQAIAGLR